VNTTPDAFRPGGVRSKGRAPIGRGSWTKNFNVYLHFLDTVSEKNEKKVRLRERQDSPIFQAAAIF
jgi:hypothetical protein